MKLQLPEPCAEALAASAALKALIRKEIAASSGWIPFSRYMELALYAPGLGYYGGGSAKLGETGDFTTAPEITPLFGRTLAHALAQLLRSTPPRLMEFGAGSGRLARDILTELAALGIAIESYAIVELSGELRKRQRDLLRDFPQVSWLDRMPEAFCGVVIGNEVLDAMPVSLVVKTPDGWRERGVRCAGEEFAFEDRPCAAALTAQIPHQASLPAAYLTELHPVPLAFMQTVARMLDAGSRREARGAGALFIDYGFPAAEYFHPQRNQGTLMCHYRHHAHPDPFYLPGLQDITAHVDFSATAHAAAEGGLEVLAYMDQANFLIGSGLAELLMQTPVSDSARYLVQANAVQKLTSPAEMGELFKVLLVGRNLEVPAGLLRADRSHRL
jgi:SAM-dependent MidA family methyltransferase